MIRAAWTYVHTFAPDILRAQQRYQELIDNATKMPRRTTTRDSTDTSPTPRTPSRFIPQPANEHGGVHWSLLALMLGSEHSSRSNVFRRTLAAGRRRIARVEEAVAAGHPTTTGVIDGLAASSTTTAPASPGIPGSTRALSGWNAACFATPAMYWSWPYR